MHMFYSSQWKSRVKLIPRGVQVLHGHAKNPTPDLKWRKKRHVGKTHDRKYQVGGQKIRVQLRSRSSSPKKYPNKLGEDANGMDPAKSTGNLTDTRPKGKREEDDMYQTGGAPPQDSSGILLSDACC